MALLRNASHREHQLPKREAALFSPFVLNYWVSQADIPYMRGDAQRHVHLLPRRFACRFYR